MKLNLFARLFLALFVCMLLTLGVMMGSVQWSFRAGFAEYLRKVQAQQLDKQALRLAQAYHNHADSWDFLRDDPAVWWALIHPDDQEPSRPGFPPPEVGEEAMRHGRQGRAHPHREAFGHPPPPFSTHPPHHPPPPHKHLFGGHLRLLDADRNEIMGPAHPVPATDQAILRPIEAEGQTIGWLSLEPDLLIQDDLEMAFIRQQALANFLILGLAFGVSVLASFFLARQILLPVRRIAVGAKQLTAGQFETRIETRRQDELGELARHFNFLARTLQDNEAARRQWIADISHELRTPLAILRGEIEALQDGVRTPTPERLGSLQAEIMRLGTLVDDLHQLSLHDLGALSYRMEPVEPIPLLKDILHDLQPRFAAHGLELRLAPTPDPFRLMADASRLRQLFLNILENSCRYTDPGGFCQVSVSLMGRRVVFDVEDTAPGVPEAVHEKLFERLFRLDRSRSRELGGSGLGLAICKSIVEALGGHIHAQPSPHGGLWIRVELGLDKEL